jgi:heme exporter protein B
VTEEKTSRPSSSITVRGLIKQFGRFAALRGVSAEFDAGRFHAILGDNGAGKTTLLRALAGLAAPTQGTISIFGKSPREACREIGYMAHPSLLYDEMSGMENLRYFARLYGIDGDARGEEAIRAVGLDPQLTRGVGQYSQGMRQRMSLARAILHDPKVLLLDEPFSNVDVHSAREMVGLLKGMRDAGKTIFVVTHQALSLATLVKDIRLEWRSKDALNSMLFFSLLVVVIFVFSFDPLAEESRHIVGGLVWVAFLFAAVVALNQTWARELRNQVLDAYRVSPAPANSLFLAKALGNFIFVSVLEALMTPLFVIFYNLHVLGPAWQLIPIGLLGTWALVVNGTFFAAMSLRTRNRELMLPLLLFPISIPAVLGMVAGTTAILTGENSARFYIVLLLTYDVVFTTASLALFETILHAE